MELSGRGLEVLSRNVRIAVLNGPNLNLLGVREPEIYGSQTLSDLERLVSERAADLGVEVDWFQTNHEGEFLERVHSLRDSVDGAIVNPAAWTHSSLAIRDAFLGVQTPFVEVHLSNIYAREPERRKSVLSDLAIGSIVGFGAGGYLMALDALAGYLNDEKA
ncbi:MAG: type II 3-dehydroquinate dehydratase [Gemmatimonadota bacterium]|nr:type II 3-dehydroquinate dehydratase [Gemmatimonadota bacterium]